ncbi:MAG TPA: hypothetical protein ENF82_01495 [Candidatus Methanomethylia archaeon]|nr:hypothetical protein [Candidatus Methanomethylicia archaeon]
MDVDWRFRELLRRAVKAVSKFFPEYMVVGGAAYNFYAPPMATADVDLLVKLRSRSAEDLVEILDLLRRQGFEVEPFEAGHWHYRLRGGWGDVDLVDPPNFSYSREAELKRRLVRLRKVGELFLASPEDLALSFVAGYVERRVLKDLARAEALIAYRLYVGDFDENYFLRRAREHSSVVEAFAAKLLSTVKASKRRKIR